MKNFVSKSKGALAAGIAFLVSNANAAVTMPTADYTNIEAAASIGFGIALTVGLLYKARGFFR